QKGRQRKILRFQLELNRNPNAYQYVDGEPVHVEEVGVDLVALAKDKEMGRIKSLSFGEFGPKVEMYGADSALGKILEYHGKIIQKHEVSVKQITGMQIL